MTLAVNVHSTDLQRKTLPSTPSEPPLHGKALAFAREQYRREVVRPAKARGIVHRHLRLVSGMTHAASSRGNATARQICAAIEDEIARGRKNRWTGSRAKAFKVLARALAAHGALPGDRAWREGLRVVAASTGLVVLRGHTVEIAFDVARAETPEDARLRLLENGQLACDSATDASDSAPVAPSENSGLACDTASPKTDSGVRFQGGPIEERPRVTRPLPSSTLPFSAWAQATGSSLWGKRIAQLLLRSGDLRGSSRDAARQLLGRAMGKVTTGGRRYTLRGTTSRVGPPSWTKTTARQTILRGFSRALERFVALGLLVRDGDAWKLPLWPDHEALVERGIREIAVAEPSPPSPAMQAHLRSNGVVGPETLSAPEAREVSKRFYADAPVPKHKPDTFRPEFNTGKPESVPRVDHCDAIHMMFVVAAEAGLRVGPQQHVDALDANLQDEAEAIGCTFHEGGKAWRAVMDKMLERDPEVLAPYLLAIMRDRTEARKKAEQAAPVLPPAPVQRVKAPASPLPADHHGVPTFIRTTPMRPWEAAAEARALANGWKQKDRFAS